MLNLRLNDYRQIYFDKEDRARIPDAVVQEIRYAWVPHDSCSSWVEGYGTWALTAAAAAAAAAAMMELRS
jgi:hypothetical protein